MHKQSRLGLVLLAAAVALAGGIFAYRRLHIAPTENPAGPVREAIRADQFEPYLQGHPDDAPHREAALEWYSHRQPNFARLREHTLLLIQHHPDSPHVFADNEGAFYAHPAYRAEVIRLLEQRAKLGRPRAVVYSNLAIICRGGALPAPTDPEARQALLRYLELPPNTALPSRVDAALADKAVRYFHQALTTARGTGGEEATHVGFYAQEEAELLYKLGRAKLALPMCAAVLAEARLDDKADFLVVYGRCLRGAGDLQKAKAILKQVRANDKEGDRRGPAHATSAAATELGWIALLQDDVKEAERQLLSACQVETCPHNTTRGLPLELATALLARGRRDPVALYCRESLRRFRPGQPQMQALLAKATAATLTSH